MINLTRFKFSCSFHSSTAFVPAGPKYTPTEQCSIMFQFLSFSASRLFIATFECLEFFPLYLNQSRSHLLNPGRYVLKRALYSVVQQRKKYRSIGGANAITHENPMISFKETCCAPDLSIRVTFLLNTAAFSRHVRNSLLGSNN